MAITGAKIADEILDLYKKFGNQDYIGEPVSQLEHMSQCAQLAMQEGYDEEVILAAFFHDIGHMCEHIMPVKYMDGFGVADHEKMGANYLLSNGFSEKIARLVNSHVNAKRYLTFKYPSYYVQLSEASKSTLQFQGGPMTFDEAILFEEQVDFDLYLALRRWDEAAKVESVPIIDLNEIRTMIISHLGNNNGVV
ncbi:MAG: HDIG domain-containing metalloprotein [Bacteroidota bacterium]